ncbi:hypothetical protein MTBBW1_1570001 [Desulfamplus magnetovallimortis]|uniref:PKD domain-containing protein n=1 Tax=Desulfamplus magnetovallimortis TaxID=1246637 RepID=A0A1W1H8S2_9BACT|nr:hypothetical protein MTBBW1_1570001 [Desulfamplus magnetovallimortis]
MGSSVAISGDYAIVGTDIGQSHSVHIFKRDGVEWISDARFETENNASASFGKAVSISGNYAIVGASTDNGDGGAGCYSGAAYIFKRDATGWAQHAKLIAADAVCQDRFADSVSISENYAIVGAWHNAGNSIEQSGAAYIFKNNGNEWLQESKLTANDADSIDYFGGSVSISGNYAIVGAYNDEEGGIGAGSSYIFKNNGSTWIQETKLIADDAVSNAAFGYSVSISDNYAIVGAYKDDENGSYSGAAYMYDIVETIECTQDDLSQKIQTYIVLTDNSVPINMPPQSYIKVMGSTNTNTINVETGAHVQLQNFIGSNQINIEEASSQFTVCRSGATVYLVSSAGTLIHIPATLTSQTLRFADGSSELIISGETILLGSQIVDMSGYGVNSPVNTLDTSAGIF